MSFIQILLIILALIAFINSHPKGDILRNLTLSSPSGVILMDKHSLNEYVLTHPRPYDIVLFIKEDKPCRACEYLNKEFHIVSESYKEQEAYKPDITAKKRAIFFAIFLLNSDTNQYKKILNFRRDVVISYTTPHLLKFSNEEEEKYLIYSEEHNLDYPENTEHTMPLLEFVNRNSQKIIELKKEPLVALIYFLLFIWLITLAISLFSNFKTFFLNPFTWHICSLIAFIVCIGGVVWDCLNGAHFVKFDNDWNIIEYVHKQQRKQYVGEGLFMSFLFVIIGSLLALLSKLNYIEGRFMRRLIGILLIGIIICLNNLVIFVYRVKVPWYSPTFDPPKGYMKGNLMKDQGNSF